MTMTDSVKTKKPASKSPPGNAPKTCPQCGRPRQHRYRPFCSERCRDVDLGNWFKGAYAIPVKDDDYDDQMPPEQSN